MTNEGFISTAAISPDSQLLACSQAEGNILVWSLSTGELRCEIPRAQNQNASFSFESIVFAAGSTRLITGSSRVFAVYNIHSGKLTQSIIHSAIGTADVRVDACRRSDSFASIYPDGTIGIWSATTGSLSWWLKDPALDQSENLQTDVSEPAFVGFSTDSKVVCGYSNINKATLVWLVATGECLHRFQSPTNDDFAIAFSSSSMLPTIATEEGDVIVLDGLTGKPKYALSIGPGRHHIAMSPDGKFAASRSSGEKLVIWTLPDNHEYQALELPSSSNGMDDDYVPSTEILFSDNGRYLILADMEHIVVWSSSLLDQEVSATGQGDMLPSELSSNGVTVAKILAANSEVVVTSSGFAKRLNIWSMTNGQLLRSVEGQWSGQMNLSPDGKYLFDSGGSNGHVMWDTGSGDSYMILGHESPHYNFEKSPIATFSTDSRFIAVSSVGGVTL